MRIGVSTVGGCSCEPGRPTYSLDSAILPARLQLPAAGSSIVCRTQWITLSSPSAKRSSHCPLSFSGRCCAGGGSEECDLRVSRHEMVQRSSLDDAGNRGAGCCICDRVLPIGGHTGETRTSR